MAEKRDYYEILGINKSASADEIKKAFRKKAVKLHPDRPGGDEEKFKEVNAAYEVLKDENKRKRYDQFGHAGVGSSAASGGVPPGYEDIFSGFGGQQGGVNVDFGDVGIGDIFESFFGGSPGGGRQKQADRGRDVEVNIQLDFEEAIFGINKTISLELMDLCPHCDGNKAEPGYELKKCPTCNGSGQQTRVTRTVFGNIQQATICSTCNGEGVKPEKDCTQCSGKGVTRQRKDIKLDIPAGINDGATIRLQGYGETSAKGIPGNLFVNIRVKSHHEFTREGDLILSDQTISMVEAALGTEIEVETVDGVIKLEIPAGTQTGSDFKLTGHGVPHMKGKKRGDHIVRILVETPKKLNKKQKELLQEFAEASGSKPFWQR
jgi:molecular chaperone DnaJ